jgi:antitoxin ParD1/3/4
MQFRPLLLDADECHVGAEGSRIYAVARSGVAPPAEIVVMLFARRLAMNVKNTITLSDRYLRYAQRLVEDGQFPSVEKVVEAGIDGLLRADQLTPDQNDAVTRMGDEIRRRIELPKDQWLPWEGEAMAEQIKAKLDEMHKKR